MAKIVNLRLARKAKARAEAAEAAGERRARFGRTKAERTVADADAARLARALEGAKREE